MYNEEIYQNELIKISDTENTFLLLDFENHMTRYLIAVVTMVTISILAFYVVVTPQFAADRLFFFVANAELRLILMNIIFMFMIVYVIIYKGIYKVLKSQSDQI